ncbi:hypothetical protein [Paraburkholderia bryophila]|uniref:Uncharacterized protein n=1 Tax=Paraburkholderia bryophila TaxID=420952 RepID=A0A329BEC9_9BURK|nr:hypothetical protein [Paraburkholderia bryophila]RAS21226.1 hypothetical protein BX591_13055 [Paraburkholderia bryophila]
MYRHLVVGCVCAVSAVSTAVSQTVEDPACPSLVTYRDGQLYSDFDRTFRKWNAANEALNDTRALRSQLTTDQQLQTAAEVAGTTLHMLNILVGALNGVLDIATVGEQGALSNVGQAAASEIVKRVSSTGSAIELVQAQTDGQMATAVAGEIPIIRGAVRFFEGLEKAQEFESLSQDAKRVLNSQLASVESSLKRIEARTARIRRAHTVETAVVSLIDQRCGKSKQPRVAASTAAPPAVVSHELKTVTRAQSRPKECDLLNDTATTSELATDNPDELNRLVQLCN